MLPWCEKIFFSLFVFFLPLQTRFILASEATFLEWTSTSLWATDILFFGAILFWLARRIFSAGGLAQRPKLSFTKSDLWLAVFLGAALLSTAAAANAPLAWYAWFKLLEMAALFYYLAHKSPQYKPLLLLALLLAAGMIQASIGIGQFSLQRDLGLTHVEAGPLGGWVRGVANFFTDSGKYIRSYGTFPHPNVLAIYLLASMAIWLYGYMAIVRKGHKGKTVLITLRAVLFVLVFAFFLTFSRAVILIGSVGLFAYALWRIRASRFDLPERLTAVNAFLILVIGYGAVIGLLWPELKSRFQFSRREEALQYRVASSESAWAIIQKYPVLGVGPGNYIPHARQFIEDAPRSLPADGLQPVHNLYLLVASELGIPAFLAFVAFFASIASQFWRAYPEYRIPAVIVIVVVIVLGSVDHYFWTLQQGRLLWWLGSGIVAAYRRPS